VGLIRPNREQDTLARLVTKVPGPLKRPNRPCPPGQRNLGKKGSRKAEPSIEEMNSRASHDCAL
jgi:hypothetical protein